MLLRRSSIVLSDDSSPVDVLFGVSLNNEDFVVDCNNKKRKIDSFMESDQTAVNNSLDEVIEGKKTKALKGYKEEELPNVICTPKKKKHSGKIILTPTKTINTTYSLSSVDKRLSNEIVPSVTIREEHELQFCQVSNIVCNEKLSSFERMFNDVVEVVNQVNKENNRGCSQHCNPFEDMLKLLQP
ncbi:hypothetical protein ABK040_012381 [Willaertia magna]